MKVKKFILPFLVVAGVFLALYLALFNYTEAYEAGIARNLVTGELRLQSGGGMHLTPPWVLVSNVDIRPTRVCLTTTARSFNCLLAEFKPEYYQEFVVTQGFRYWWWANRFSFNFGYDEEYRGFRDVLRGYAFGSQPRPFVTVTDGYNN